MSKSNIFLSEESEKLGIYFDSEKDVVQKLIKSRDLLVLDVDIVVDENMPFGDYNLTSQMVLPSSTVLSQQNANTIALNFALGHNYNITVGENNSASSFEDLFDTYISDLWFYHLFFELKYVFSFFLFFFALYVFFYILRKY